MSNVNTPFIPPLALHTPNGPQGGTPLPGDPPVIPGQPPGAPLPGWGATAQHSGSFPAGYPHTMYNAATPYVPGHAGLPYTLGHAGLSYTPGSAPGGYFPASPAQPPLLQRPLIPHPRDPGVSSDYIGYPTFLGSPATPLVPVHPATPYTPMSAPLPGAAQSGWGPPTRPGYPHSFAQPMSAGPYPNFALPPQAAPAWAAHVTPAAPYPMHLDPYGGAAMGGHPMTWAAAAAMMQPAAHHAPARAPPPTMHLPQHLVGTATASARAGDRMDPFTPGRNYGPVLEPFLLKVVGSTLKINPLLQPLPENGEDRPHLKWNMLFGSNACQRSTDPGHVSWSKGRHDPVTFPRVTKINIVSETFPWMITIHAADPSVGVLCGELIDGLSENLHKLTSASDYKAAPDAKRAQIGEAYRYNRSRVPGVPGGRLGEGLKRLDFLARDSTFGGIYGDDRLVRKLIGEAMPATFVLRCVRQYALTPDELREHEARERGTDGEDRRRATVETVSDSTADDDDD